MQSAPQVPSSTGSASCHETLDEAPSPLVDRRDVLPGMPHRVLDKTQGTGALTREGTEMLRISSVDSLQAFRCASRGAGWGGSAPSQADKKWWQPSCHGAEACGQAAWSFAECADGRAAVRTSSPIRVWQAMAELAEFR